MAKLCTLMIALCFTLCCAFSCGSSVSLDSTALVQERTSIEQIPLYPNHIPLHPLPPQAMSTLSQNEMWAKMRPHINPMGVVTKAKHRLHFPSFTEAGLVAGRQAQAACSQLINRGHGELTPQARSDLVDAWRSQHKVNCTTDETSATCTVAGLTQKYTFVSETFGCVHDNFSSRSGPLLKWSSVKRPLGIDPHGKAHAKAKAAVLEQQPKMRVRTAEKEEALFARTAVGRTLLTWVDKLMSNSKTHAVAISHRGHIVERYNKEAGVGPETRLHGWHMSQSLLSLLVGKRIDEGKLALNDFAKAPELTQEEIQNRALRIQTLISMRAGKSMEASFEKRESPMLYFAPNSAAYTLGTPGDSRVGHFYYSPGLANVLSRELRYTFPEGEEGQAEYAAYPWTALFSKIGADSFTCEADTAGTILFSSFCYAKAKDWVKVGQLIVNNGTWPDSGEKVIPGWWIDDATRSYMDYDGWYSHMFYRLDQMGKPIAKEASQGVLPTIIAARGLFNQELIIVPQLHLVFFRSGASYVDLLPDQSGDHAELFDMLEEAMKVYFEN